MYYITTTAKRKNAKRHIAIKGENLEMLKKSAERINRDRYIVEVYNGRWELVGRI